MEIGCNAGAQPKADAKKAPHILLVHAPGNRDASQHQ
jgi:hypothetical protein